MSEQPDTPVTERTRIAIFSRYNLAEQYDLATEFREVVRRLAARAEVFHLSLRGPRSPDEVPEHVTVSELPISVNRKSPRDIMVKTFLTYLTLPLAARRLRRFRADLIFLTECFPLWAWLLKVLCRTRVASGYGDWHIHNIFGRYWWSRPMLRLVEAVDRFEARRLKGFLCRAESAGARLQSWGVEPDRIRVVRDAPDPTAFFPRDESALRAQCGFAPDDVVLLYHGVMHQGKGLDKLIHWVNELYGEFPQLGLLLVGGGREEAALRELAATLAMKEHIVFTGWLETIKEVGAYCNAADICIAMRTGAEANDKVVPGALLHAMACKKIVIGPRLRGIGEIIDEGRNGYMFETDNAEDFKRLIRKLVAERADWPRIQEQAHKDIQDHHSVEAVARQYAEMLEHFAGL